MNSCRGSAGNTSTSRQTIFQQNRHVECLVAARIEDLMGVYRFNLHNDVLRASIPGSDSPERNWRRAPPPVERSVYLSAKWRDSMTGSVSPPPTIVVA